MDSMRLENLGSGVAAVISDEHGFGTDALLLADFANPNLNDRCCDMGSGCGIIPLLWCRKNLKNPVKAIEISEKACSQIEKAKEISSLQDKIDVFNIDLRTVKEHIEAGSIDVLTMNPPYKAEGRGIVSQGQAQAVARHGLMCNLDDMCAAAQWLLRFGGRFCVCLRPERLCELMVCMSKHAIEPKRLKTVSKKDGTAPWLILVEGKRGAKVGMNIEPQLNVYKSDGTYCDYIKSLYEDYEKEKENNLKRRGEN